MTNNIDFSKARSLVYADQLANVETMHSLQKVSEEIKKAMAVVEGYKKKVEDLQPPIVNGQPWYKLPFGKASVSEFNKTLESFSSFVQETFKTIADTQNCQNENDMNICRLIGLLAMAEANAFEKLNEVALDIKELSTEDEESAKQLKELEKSFLQSLDDTSIDSEKKKEQISRLIKYVTCFAENKTKKIRNISLKLSEIYKRLDKYCTTQDSWIEEAKGEIDYWQQELNKSLSETKDNLFTTLQTTIKEKNTELDERFGKMRICFEESITKQDAKIDKEIKQQNEKIEISYKAVDDKIAEYKLIIDEQDKTIKDQDKVIQEQCTTISLLAKKVNFALSISVLSIVSFAGFLLYFWFVL